MERLSAFEITMSVIGQFWPVWIGLIVILALSYIFQGRLGLYGKLLGSPYHLFFVNNRHPIVPLSTLRAGFRLMLHGLSAEQLHYHLRQCKRRQERGELVVP